MDNCAEGVSGANRACTSHRHDLIHRHIRLGHVVSSRVSRLFQKHHRRCYLGLSWPTQRASWQSAGVHLVAIQLQCLGKAMQLRGSC